LRNKGGNQTGEKSGERTSKKKKRHTGKDGRNTQCVQGTRERKRIVDQKGGVEGGEGGPPPTIQRNIMQNETQGGENRIGEEDEKRIRRGKGERAEKMRIGECIGRTGGDQKTKKKERRKGRDLLKTY